jgi:YD repeat-containing protein
VKEKIIIGIHYINIIMKKLILCFLLLLGFGAKAQFFYHPFPPAKADYALNEKAQVKVCNEYKLTGNEKSLSKILEYGNEGLPVVLYEKNIDDNGDSITVATSYYKYTGGRLVQEEVISHEGDGGYTVGYTYNAAGQLLQQIVVQADPPTYTYVYDKSGKIIQATITAEMPDENGNPADMPQGKEAYTYNAKGQLVQATNYSQDNEKQFIHQWQYNTKGQIVKVTGLRSVGEVAYEELLEYGNNNLLSKRTLNRPGGETEIYVYEYCTDCGQSWKKQ